MNSHMAICAQAHKIARVVSTASPARYHVVNMQAQISSAAQFAMRHSRVFDCLSIAQALRLRNHHSATLKHPGGPYAWQNAVAIVSVTISFA